MTKPNPAREPDLVGPAATAWRVDLATAKQIPPNPDDATVALWIVYAPNSHPVWPCVAISLVHLRDLEGMTRAPTINLPGATHEIIVAALQPDSDIEAAIHGDLNALRYLTPLNFGAQFVASDDVAALQRVKETVGEVVAGILNPDSDGFSQWVARYGDNGVKVAYRKPAGGVQ